MAFILAMLLFSFFPPINGNGLVGTVVGYVLPDEVKKVLPESVQDQLNKAIELLEAELKTYGDDVIYNVNLIKALYKWKQEGLPVQQILMKLVCEYPDVHKRNLITTMCENDEIGPLLSAIPGAAQVCYFIYKYMPVIEALAEMLNKGICEDYTKSNPEAALKKMTNFFEKQLKNQANSFVNKNIKGIRASVKNLGNDMLKTGRQVKGKKQPHKGKSGSKKKG